MRKIVLSERLQAVADLVPPGSSVCDVGCDHGWVSVYLVEQGISTRVIAMDINPGPLSGASEHVDCRGLSPYIEIRLSDGLAALKLGEADTLMIAGMGSRTMRHILEAEPEKLRCFQHIILQPQSEIPEFRRYLRESGYRLMAEEMVREGDHFYPIMVLCPRQISSATDQHIGPLLPEDRWGALLLAEQHPVLKEYLEWKLNRNRQVLASMSLGTHTTERFRVLCEETKEIERIMSEWYRILGDTGGNR